MSTSAAEYQGLGRTAFAQIPIELLDACVTRKHVIMVYLWLWYYADQPEGGSVLLDVLIARKSKISLRAVKQAKKWLTENGWLRNNGTQLVSEK